jgi:hypothetical protein
MQPLPVMTTLSLLLLLPSLSPRKSRPPGLPGPSGQSVKLLLANLPGLCSSSLTSASPLTMLLSLNSSLLLVSTSTLLVSFVVAGASLVAPRDMDSSTLAPRTSRGRLSNFSKAKRLEEGRLLSRLPSTLKKRGPKRLVKLPLTTIPLWLLLPPKSRISSSS